MQEEAVKKFKKLYKKRFGKELSDDEALRRATRLLALYRAVYGSLSSYQRKEQMEKNKKCP